MRKFVPPGRRTIIVASVSAALACAALALAGGGTAVQGAGHGLARAGSSGTAVSSLASGPATSTFGPTVIDGIYQGESPPVSQLPILPVKIPMICFKVKVSTVFSLLTTTARLSIATLNSSG